MLKLYSNVEDGVLLHVINRRAEIGRGRIDMSPDGEALQVSCLGVSEGREVRPHDHLAQQRDDGAVQESWVVVDGRMRVTLYDLDHSVLHTGVLERGDCAVTFRGGHAFTALSDDTVFYEMKTGPYRRGTEDKQFL